MVKGIASPSEHTIIRLVSACPAMSVKLRAPATLTKMSNSMIMFTYHVDVVRHERSENAELYRSCGLGSISSSSTMCPAPLQDRDNYRVRGNPCSRAAPCYKFLADSAMWQ